MTHPESVKTTSEGVLPTLDLSGDTVTTERKKFSFKDWYGLNKTAIAMRRKLKYSTDPEYRAKLKLYADKYRKSKPKTPRKQLDRITIPKLCEASNCNEVTYRKYCSQGWIPLSKGKVIFTDTHIKALSELCIAAKEARYVRNNRLQVLQPYIDAVHLAWAS